MNTPTRDTDQNPGAITHRDGETTGGGDAPLPPPPEQMETVAGAGGEGESDESALQSTSSGEGEKKMELMEKPPADDVCPICFDHFHVPCRTSCGHWYCGGCILQYWNYSSSMLPCKCPMCFLSITKLTPEASWYHRREVEIRKVLCSVCAYNRLFGGGTRGFILKFLAIPLMYLKRLFYDMLLNPDRPSPNFMQVRLFTMGFDIHNSFYPIEYLRIAHWNIPGPWSYMKVSDYIALALVMMVYFYKLYLRRRRDRNARALMVIPAE